jgi:hypothetical protein
MKTINTRQFTRDFALHRRQPCQVKDRQKLVGTWTPAGQPAALPDFAARVQEDFPAKLPFTGASLLKSGKKR